jgi:uncharacterized Zn finger protein
MAWKKSRSRRGIYYGYSYDYSGWGFKPYVPVAERRAEAERRLEKLRKKGEKLDPVRLEGPTIARTFWGKAWCDHLESHSDFANRLPRGRSYVRNGSVCDLKIEPGRVRARIVGNDLYEAVITIKKLPTARWAAIRRKCAGGIASLIELLQGRLSAAVMKIITDRENGLFPRPAEIEMSCSCPDWATMCKHVAATLYGVGARLDDRPELLFLLRGVDHQDLLSERAITRLVAGGKRSAKAGTSAPATGKADKRTEQEAGETLNELAESELAEVFGVDIVLGPAKRKVAAKRRKDRVVEEHDRRRPAPRLGDQRRQDRGSRRPSHRKGNAEKFQKRPAK